MGEHKREGVISVLMLKECPYYRASESVAMGRGLGHCDLSGSQAICEGDIRFCDSRDHLRRQLLEEKKKESDKKPVDREDNSTHYKVLVVDDQEPVRNLVVLLLTRQGHQCVTAENGADALRKMIRGRCDAVITDIIMPEKDGIALTKDLLNMFPKLPILIMTAHGKEHSAESALKAGARDFIGKPFSIDEFILRFDKMMRDHAALLRMETR